MGRWVSWVVGTSDEVVYHDESIVGGFGKCLYDSHKVLYDN